MRLLPLVLASLLALPVASAATTKQVPATSLAERATERAERIGDAGAFLDEIDEAIEMARAGEYGRLEKGAMVRIERARDTIRELLAGHGSAMELQPEQRIELYNAQETITAAIRSDEKNRTVCKREAVTGSRLPKTECMSVAEREARRKLAAENTDKLMRSLCHAGEGNRCTTD